MQTTGAALLAVRRCSLVRMRMLAQDSRCAYGLLYVAAVQPQSLGNLDAAARPSPSG